MTTIIHNPRSCCFTCDDFLACLEDTKLQLTISGIPSDITATNDCDTCYCTEFERWPLNWNEQRTHYSSLNDTHTLDYVGDGRYCWLAPGATSGGVRAGILVLELDEGLCCEDEEMVPASCPCTVSNAQAAHYFEQTWLNKIEADIICDSGSNRMLLAGVRFIYCIFNKGGSENPNDWGPAGQGGCPLPIECDGSGVDFPLCEITDDDVQVAIPCTSQPMKIAVKWETLSWDECNLISSSCNPGEDGEIVARIIGG